MRGATDTRLASRSYARRQRVKMVLFHQKIILSAHNSMEVGVTGLPTTF